MATETSILETVLTKAREMAIPHDAPETIAKPEPTPAKKPETPIAAKPDKVAEELATIKARNAELEAKIAGDAKTIEDLKKLETARDLWKSKKRLEAIEILGGMENSEEELDEFVKEYIKAPSKETKSAVESKLDQLLDREKKKDEDAAKAKEAEAAKAQQAKKDALAKATADNVAYTSSIVAKHPDKFDLCGRAKHKEEVGAKAPIIALECLRRDKVDLKTMTPEQAEKAMIEALAEIETELEKDGIANYLKTAKEKPSPEVKVSTEKKDDPAIRVPSPEIKVSVSPKPGSIGDVIERAKKRALYQ